MRQQPSSGRRCTPRRIRTAAAQTPAPTGGRDELRLVPSPICQIFNRRKCQDLGPSLTIPVEFATGSRTDPVSRVHPGHAVYPECNVTVSIARPQRSPFIEHRDRAGTRRRGVSDAELLPGCGHKGTRRSSPAIRSHRRWRQCSLCARFVYKNPIVFTHEPLRWPGWHSKGLAVCSTRDIVAGALRVMMQLLAPNA
jgi:hypothetical protein